LKNGAVRVSLDEVVGSPRGGSGADEIRFEAGLTGTITLNRGPLAEPKFALEK
jgi:hypothetical protein